MSDRIDVVIPYVDGSTEGYEELCRQWTGSFVPCHVRSFGELRFTLRSIAKHMPWVRRVFLAVQGAGHVPRWLDTSAVTVVCHEAFIPAEHRPTFHWATIAAHLHRVEGLSERYVQWDDDVLARRELHPSFFFDRAGDPITLRCTLPLWQRPWLPGLLDAYGRNLAETHALLRRAGAGARAVPTFIYAHMPLACTRSSWRRFVEQHLGDPVFADTVTRRSRGDERSSPTIDPCVAYANWSYARTHAARRWPAHMASILRAALQMICTHHGVRNDLERTRKTLGRLRSGRALFSNINDEAYDGWVDAAGATHSGADLHPELPGLVHHALLQLFPDPSRYEVSPGSS